MVQGYEPIPTILSGILFLLISVILVHMVFYHKSTAVVPQPIYIIEENNPNPTIILNNVAYNPTMMNLKGIIVILLPVLLCLILPHLIFYIWINFDSRSELNFEAIVEYFLRIYACFVSPLMICICNKNVRKFAMKIVSKDKSVQSCNAE